MSTSAKAFGPGRLEITVTVGRDGQVGDVAIVSSRPTSFSSALFVNRPADDVPHLVGRLHALCGLSHATASAAAIAAARGDDAVAAAGERFEGLLAERLGEHMRSIFMAPGSGGPGQGAPGHGGRETLADLRAVLASARGLVSQPGGPPEVGARDAAIEAIGVGIRNLGLRHDGPHGLRMPVGSWASETVMRLGAASGDVHLDADPLTAADDAAVITALSGDSVGFAAAPHLAGRVPETGPFARATVQGHGGRFDGAGRVMARLREVAEAAALLADDEPTRRAAFADWITVGTLAGHTGYAAVESPRGRLHHLVRVDAAGRVASYAILAPTEWNFGAAGPLVATLRANRLHPGSDGVARVERIAASLDPCVGFEVRVEERADA